MEIYLYRYNRCLSLLSIALYAYNKLIVRRVSFNEARVNVEIRIRHDVVLFPLALLPAASHLRVKNPVVEKEANEVIEITRTVKVN